MVMDGDHLPRLIMRGLRHDLSSGVLVCINHIQLRVQLQICVLMDTAHWIPYYTSAFGLSHQQDNTITAVRERQAIHLHQAQEKTHNPERLWARLEAF